MVGAGEPYEPCRHVSLSSQKISSLTEPGQTRVFSPDSPFAHFNPSSAFVDVSFRPQIPKSPDVNPPKNTNIYERRPRHKTTESRYEYKRQRQQQPANRSRKMRKQARKHTLNETFRAGNVVPARLTVCRILTSHHRVFLTDCSSPLT